MYGIVRQKSGETRLSATQEHTRSTSVSQIYLRLPNDAVCSFSEFAIFSNSNYLQALKYDGDVSSISAFCFDHATPLPANLFPCLIILLSSVPLHRHVVC